MIVWLSVLYQNLSKIVCIFCMVLDVNQINGVRPQCGQLSVNVRKIIYKRTKYIQKVLDKIRTEASQAKTGAL